MAGHGGAAGNDADEVVREPAPEKGGEEAFAEVEERNGERVAKPQDAEDVRRAGVSAPARADVDPGDRARDPVSPRQAAEDVTERDQADRGQVSIWYFDTQSFTTSQSRFAKKASM